MRARLSYANVMATIAVFLALTGTTYAATKIGTAQLRNGAVTNPKLAPGAVTSGKVQIRIDQRFPLAQVREAHQALEARKTTGSTILTV